MGYEDPKTILRNAGSQGFCSDHYPVDEYINFIYHLQGSRARDTIRWRLGLIPLADLAAKFTNGLVNTETYDEIADLLVSSGHIIHNREEVRKELPSWISASRRYKGIAKDLKSLGSLCCLPIEPSDYL